MADSQTELSLELDRVIGCRYPASLVNLAKYLAAADALSIRASISERPPCEVTKLASIVTAALPLWQYTIDILRSLSNSAEFSRYLLLSTPSLLDALLTKATSSQSAFEEYAELCITLLSRRLPDSVPLPASAQSFFLRVLEQTTATDTLGASALKSLYCMLNGACLGLIGLLPFQARQSFDDKLSFMLASPGTGQSSILMLWCFGLTILAEHPAAFSGNWDHQTNLVAPDLEWRTKAGRKIFEHGHKTVKLAYLNVLWATKGGVGVADEEALEAIRIASRTLQFVDKRTREGWPTSSAMASDMFARLPSKILRTGIDSGIQLEALRFYASIAGGNKIPQELVTQYGRSLIDTCRVADSQSWKECLSMSLAPFSVQMQQTDLTSMLECILQVSIMSASAICMTNTGILCDELAAIATRFPGFRSQLIAALSSSDIEALLQKFLLVQCLGHDQSQRCQSHVEVVRRSLIASTISMVLATALAPGTNEASLPNSMSIALLRKQQHLPAVANHCNHQDSPVNASSISLFQQECTPLTGTHLQDWKEHLKSELENQRHFQQDSIVRSVIQICHDLEIRCETVEAPLRQERDKSRQLANDVASLQKELKSLELKRWEDSEHINALDSDNERVEQERDRIEAQFVQLKNEFEDATSKSSEALRAAQAKHDTMQANLQSLALEHEEDARARRIEIADLQQSVSALSNKLHEAELKRQTLAEHAKTLQENLEGTQYKLEMEQKAKNQQDTAVIRLEHEVGGLQNQLRETNTELVNVNERLSDLQLRHDQLVETSQANAEKLEKQHEHALKTAVTKAEHEYQLLNNRLHETTDQREMIEKAYKELQTNLQQLQATIPPLHAKIEDLTNETLAKDVEVEELSSSLHDLKQWRNRIYESMGLPPEVASVSRLAHQAPDSRSPRSHRRRKSTKMTQDSPVGAPSDTQSISNTAMDTIANATFSSSGSVSSQSGSTPKRPKMRSSFKVPKMHTPYSNRVATASKSTSRRSPPTKRSVLRAISPDRRHTTVGFAVPENEVAQDSQQNLPFGKRRASLGEDEQLDSDVDSFLAGTPRCTPTSGVTRSDAQSATEL